MIKNYLWAAAPLLLRVICFLLSGWIGTSIDANGVLHEPAFFLIPLGYFFCAVGIIALLRIVISQTMRKKD